MLQQRIMPEINQKSQSLSRRSEIIDGLGPVFVRDLLECLEFDNDFSATEKIRNIGLFQKRLLVSKPKTRMFFKWNASACKFQRQALLIDALQKSTPHFFIDLETSPHDLKAFFLEQDPLFHFRVFRVFRGSTAVHGFTRCFS